MERHLAGALREHLPSLGGAGGRVGVKISGRLARSRSGQKLLWTACNLLCRLKGVVAEIEVCVQDRAAVAEPGLVRPGPWSGGLLESLAGALRARSRDCSVSAVHGDLDRGAAVAILLGRGTSTRSRPGIEVHASCDGWLADCWYGDNAPPGSQTGGSGGGEGRGSDGNPFGAVAAACIAVGEAFKHLGCLKYGAGWPWHSARFSMYDLRSHDARKGGAPANPPLPDQVDAGRLYVCGCGAVGHSFCQCLDMTPGIGADLLLVDRRHNAGRNDELIDGTNLARYVMCTNGDVGRPKAEALLEKMRGRDGTAVSHTDDGIESLACAGSGGPRLAGNAVSCVDNNAARHALQDLLPRRILGGSVYELRSQVSVYDLASATQCLKCNNPIADKAADAEARQVPWQAAPAGAARAGETTRPAPRPASRAATPGAVCGALGAGPRALLAVPAAADPSVNFVTMMSGAVLAAELVKSSCGSLAPALDCNPHTDLFYSFWNGHSRLTETRPRPDCWCSAASGAPLARHRHGQGRGGSATGADRGGERARLRPAQRLTRGGAVAPGAGAAGGRRR